MFLDRRKLRHLRGRRWPPIRNIENTVVTWHDFSNLTDEKRGANGILLASLGTCLLPRELIFEFSREFTDIGRIAESFQLLFCRFNVNTQALTNFLLHLEHGG